MSAALKACLLLAVVATPLYAQTSPNREAAEPLNCPMMTDVDQMQKQMSGMMNDMRTMMDGTNDPAVKSRMQTMHERMTAMMANMERMHGRMRAPAAGNAKAAEPPATQAPNSAKQNHEEHHL